MCNIIKKKRVTESRTTTTIDASAPPPQGTKPSIVESQVSVPGNNQVFFSADRLTGTNDSDRNPQKTGHSKSAKEIGSKARSVFEDKKSKERADKKIVPIPTLITRRDERDKQLTTVEHTQAEQSSEQRSSQQPTSRMGDIPFILVTSTRQKKKKKRSLTKTKSVPSSLKSSSDANSKEAKKPKGNPEDDTLYPKNQRKPTKDHHRNRTLTTSVSESGQSDGSQEKEAVGVSPTQDDDGPENYMYSDDDIVFVCHEQIAGLENDDLTRLEDFALMTRPFTKWNPYATVEEMEDRHLFTRGVLTQYTLTSTGMTFPNQNDVAHILDTSTNREKTAKSPGGYVHFVESKEGDLALLNRDDVMLKKPVKDHTMSLSENKTMISSVSKISNMSKARGNKSGYKDDCTNESERSRSFRKGKSVSKKSNSRSRHTGNSSRAKK